MQRENKNHYFAEWRCIEKFRFLIFYSVVYVEGLSLNFTTTGMELCSWCETGVVCHLIPAVGFEPWTSLSYQENAILLGLPELS